MKKIFTIISLFICLKAISQEPVQILFQYGTPGNYDVFIKDVLNKSGYKAYVNYGELDTSFKGKILVYDILSRTEFDELFKYSFKVYNGKKLFRYNENKVFYFSTSVAERKKIVKALGEVFGKKLNDAEVELNSKPVFSDIKLYVSKLDSAKFFISAKAKVSISDDYLRSAFFAKCRQYLESYDYYFEEFNTSDNKNAVQKSSFATTDDNLFGSKTITGIIYGNGDISMRRLIKTKPKDYEALFIKPENSQTGKDKTDLF